jgi:hypothetical protein
MRTSARFVVGVAVSFALLLAVGIRPASAETAPTAADAEKFAGDWVLGLDTPQGAMSMNLTLKNAGGKLTGSLTSDIAPDPQAISDITKDGDSLVLKYQLDFQGQAIPAMITLKPLGAKWTANFDFAGGQFNMDGTATKK